MTPFSVRLALPQDAFFLPAVERSAGVAFKKIKDLAWVADDDVLSAKEHLAYIEQGSTWVAEGRGTEGREGEEKDKTVGEGRFWGFLCAQPMADCLYIAELSVRHERQGQGIGKALLSACMQYAAQQGYAALTLTTFRHVSWNMPLYAHLGFTEVLADHLPPELKAIVAQEEQAGFLPSLRCVMQYALV